MEKKWKVYMLRCGDGSLYTGIAVDVEQRLEVHRSGKGAKYTRGRRPVVPVYTETCSDHSIALKRELEIKAMSREQKLKPSQAQFEAMLDATHPRLIKLYWPVAGGIRTIRDQGITGMIRKIMKHRKG